MGWEWAPFGISHPHTNARTLTNPRSPCCRTLSFERVREIHGPRARGKVQMQTSRLLGPLPTYLGPHWYARVNPERLLQAFLRRHEGSATSKELCAEYASQPWLKTAVGSLKEFCAHSNGLSYSARQSSRPATISLSRTASRANFERKRAIRAQWCLDLERASPRAWFRRARGQIWSPRRQRRALLQLQGNTLATQVGAIALSLPLC